MIFGSVCSGIEAASSAWHPLGWQAAFVSEIEPFPCAVLAHHYPAVPNLGDMTEFKEWPNAKIDVLVGGTPCQSFSVAGLRAGLADPRGNLMLTYLAIADRYRPEWLVWENVPGVLSSGGGRDFGTFLRGLAELGYGFAYRVLNAEHFGVPQRRRRVFVVANLRDWRRAAAVLFERESLRGDSPPSREAGEKTSGPIAGCSNGGGANGPGRTADDADSLIEVAGAVTQRIDRGGVNSEGGDGHLIPIGIDEEGNASVDQYGPLLRGGQGGTKQSVYCPSIAFDSRQDPVSNAELFGALGSSIPQAQAVAFAQNTRDEVREMAVVGALAAEPGMKQTSYIRSAMQVRRLTPRECERLQGFPDDYTLITVRNKPAADGPRYKALGNSMAVPCMKWLGGRIQMVSEL